VELFIKGAKVVLTHKPVTLRNAETLTAWATKLRNHVMANAKQAQQRFMRDITTKYPDILDVLTVEGEVSPSAIAKFVERDRASVEYHNNNLQEGEEPIEWNEAKSMQDAVAHVNKTIGDMMKDTPAIAKILQFTMPAFGEDLESLKLGIDCIIATYDDSKFDADQNAAIKDKDSDHWLDASAAEVATYVNNFLDRCS